MTSLAVWDVFALKTVYVVSMMNAHPVTGLQGTATHVLKTQLMMTQAVSVAVMTRTPTTVQMKPVLCSA
jgi:hypothetical protein